MTGESVTSALRFVEGVRGELLAEVSDTASLREFAQRRRAQIDANPAAWCAVELAVLDLFGRQNGRSIDAELGLPELSGNFTYTAVLGDSGAGAFESQLKRYLQMGFADLKVKLSGDPARDRDRMRMIRELASGVRLRADANNLWPSAAPAIAYLRALGAPFFALEEPVRTGDYASLAAVAEAVGSAIILDESCSRVAQVRALEGPRERWIVNLRVSKMGGLLRSIDVVEEARKAGLRLVIGAQVGETSVLTRAALTVANAARDILVAQEGAFGTLLLENDVCEPPVMFGKDGVLADAAQRFAGRPGLGLEIHRAG